MNILLVNDDGIYAEGIRALAASLKGEHKVTMVAPDKQMSGTAHSVTFHGYLNYKKIYLEEGVDSYMLGGTPADCVKFGIEMITEQRPDLVISGINDGFNIGTDVFYSGTVNAAVEASLIGVKAIAVSRDDDDKGDYVEAAEFIRARLNALCSIMPDSETLLSINIPSSPRGVRFGKVGNRKYCDEYRFIEGKGYLIAGYPAVGQENDDETDVNLIGNGYTVITPIKTDYNDYAMLDKLRGFEL